MRTAILVTCALFVAVAVIPGAATADHVPCIEEKGKGHWPGPDSHGRLDPDSCVDSGFPGTIDPCSAVENYVSC